MDFLQQYEAGAGAAPALLPRNLGELLNETFAICGKHRWRLAGLVAMVQLPVSLLLLVPRGHVVGFAAVALVSVLASVAAYGATIFALGQHYSTGTIKIRSCYSRVWWRVLSLLIVVAVVAGLGLLWDFVASTVITARSTESGVVFTAIISLVVVIPVLLVLLYAVFVPQALIMEKRKLLAAFRRSYQLFQRSRWRVLGFSLVILLVVLGLGIIVTIPFALVMGAAGLNETSTLMRVLQALNNLAVGVVVLPVAFSAITLLYYDQRIRAENYDMASLRREMGAAESS